MKCFSVAAFKFQENLLKTMLQIENTFFQLGESLSRNCLIICDRGAMDASACKFRTSKLSLYIYIYMPPSRQHRKRNVIGFSDAIGV